MGHRRTHVLTLLGIAAACCLPLAGGSSRAENVDPGNDGSQYAWAENAGWMNAEPSGNGGSGLQVADFEITGYMWGENVGWISMSCKNGSTCGTTNYGVINNGQGILSGYAWSENAGWINFAPATAGVTINAVTGDFAGRAWGENVGWITFASNGANPFKVRTGWTCSPAPSPPPGGPVLTVGQSGATTLLSWSGIAGATGYDIVRGNLTTLRSSGGNFILATEACLSNNRTTLSMTFSEVPAAGQGFWFLLRGANCGGSGSYDSFGPTQVGLRDPEIAASGNDCN